MCCECVCVRERDIEREPESDLTDDFPKSHSQTNNAHIYKTALIPVSASQIYTSL